MKTFVNPYNFIPLTGDKKKYDGEGEPLTGVIEYSVLTKTPLFIPNTSNNRTFPEKDDPEEHKSYDFFSYENLESGEKNDYRQSYRQPVIPGSEIRGMCRSNYEILTGSCMSAVDSESVLSKRTAETFKPGLIRKNKDGTYSLIEAEVYLWRTYGENSVESDLTGNWEGDPSLWRRKCYVQDNIKEGEKVWFQKIDRRGRGEKKITPLVSRVAFEKPNDTENYKIGYVLKGEEGPVTNKKQNKHCCRIFAGNGKVVIDGEFEFKKLEQVLKEYLKNDKKDTKENAKEEGKQEINPELAESAGSEGQTAASGMENEKQKNAGKASERKRYEEYAEQLEVFRNKKTAEPKKLEELKKSVESKKQKESKVSEEDFPMFPVYYSCIGQLLMLSPACITREIYDKKIEDIIKSFSSCTDKKNLCPTCSLFGMVQKGNAVASKIRFTDLFPEERKELSEYYETVTTLPALSSPKISNTEFYLKRPGEAVFWTYDYSVDKDGRTHLYSAEAAGRKFYWHQMDMELPAGFTRTRFNMSIRPVRKGVTFRGKIYFQDIPEKDLKRLIWLIEAGDGADIQDKKYGYKLGAAKPLGFGSIAMKIDRVGIRHIVLEGDRVKRFEAPYQTTCDDSLFDANILENYRKMTGFDTVRGEWVSYPMTPEQAESGKTAEEGFKWFTENHLGYNYKKKDTVDMLNSRAQMYFGEYMEAMEPVLKRTSKDLPLKREKAAKKSKSKEIRKGRCC